MLNENLKTMTQYDRWLVYERYDGDESKLSKKRKGDIKTPQAPKTHEKTGGFKSKSGSFELAEADAQTGNYITGFLFDNDSPFSCIDIDHAFQEDGNGEAIRKEVKKGIYTKVLKEHAKAIVENFDSYTEVSPSGKGLHIIVKGKCEGMRPTENKTNDGVEIMSEGVPVRLSMKPLTLFDDTGEVISYNKPIRSASEKLLSFRKEYKAIEVKEPRKALERVTDSNNIVTERRNVNEGGRNAYLTELLGKYCGIADLSKEQIKGMIIQANRELKEPLSEYEVNNTVLKSLEKYYVKNEKHNLKKHKEIEAELKAEAFDLNSLSIVGMLEAFQDEMKQNKKLVPTSFNNLDVALYGGLGYELYMLGGETGIGKSAFTYQLALQIARSGVPVYYFALEMSKNEMIARVISHYSKETKKPYTTGEIIYKKYDEMAKAFTIVSPKQYEEELKRISEELKSLHIVSFDTYSNIMEMDEIKALCDKVEDNAVIIIDYLQIIQVNKEGVSTDKQKIDYSVAKLKEISSKHPVICLSSFNRPSYNTEHDTSSFKASGEIEYTGSILFSYEDLGEVSKYSTDIYCEEARYIALRMMKFRNGQKGQKLYYKFHYKHNYYEEITMAQEKEYDKCERAYEDKFSKK